MKANVSSFLKEKGFCSHNSHNHYNLFLLCVCDLYDFQVFLLRESDKDIDHSTIGFHVPSCTMTIFKLVWLNAVVIS